MNTAPLAIAEITTTAITILCREIGAVNTARFLNQFASGFGDYTQQRDKIIGNSTVDDIVAEIKQRRAKARGQSKRTHNRPRPTNRST